MSKVVARSIFNEAVAERDWKSYVTSGVVHAAMIAAAFFVTFPAVKVIEEPIEQHVTLMAPILPKDHPKIEPPRIQHVTKLTMPVTPAPVAKTIPPPILPKPKPVEKAISPPVVSPQEQPKIAAEIKPAALPAPPPPKPVLKTGTFEDAQLAKAEAVRKQVVVGGFGDPRGVNVSDHPTTSPVLMARVGSFENPQGAGNSGGGGHLDTGSVKNSGFGNATVPTGISGNGKANSVRTGNFGDGSALSTGSSTGGAVKSSGFGDAIAAAPQRKEIQNPIETTTPVEILFKPRPSYSAEARELRLEGEVSLQVIFQASGSVRVVRVIKGLGHGLDEAAEQAAQQVKFKPATRSGAPVDTNATIKITFELT